MKTKTKTINTKVGLRGRGAWLDWAKHAIQYAKDNKFLSKSLGAAGGLGLSSGNLYGQIAGGVATGLGTFADYMGYGKKRRRYGRGKIRKIKY